MSIFHHTIDSRGPGGDPRQGTGRELPGTVRELVFDKSMTIRTHFQQADHVGSIAKCVPGYSRNSGMCGEQRYVRYTFCMRGTPFEETSAELL